MNTLKKAWYTVLSGGGAQAFDSPAPLILAPVSTTQIDAYWLDVGQDNSILYRNTVNDFDSATEIYNGSNLTYSDTGRTINTTYYYWVVSSLSGVESDAVTGNAKTFSKALQAFYSVVGAALGTDNSWATTTGSALNTLKSYFGSGPDITPAGAGITVRFIDDFQNQWIKGGGQFANFDSDITLTGDFTFAFRLQGLGGATEALFSKASDGDQNYVWINTINSTLQTKINNVTANLTYPSGISLSNTELYTLVLQRIGTDLSVGILDDDGNLTFGTSKTTSSGTFVLNRFLANSTGGNITNNNVLPIAFHSGGNLTAAELIEYFHIKNLPALSPATADAAPKFTGTWRTPTDGYVNDVTSVSDNGTRHRVNSLNIYGNICAIMNNKKSTEFSDGLLTLVDGDTDLVSTAKVLPHYIESTDIHQGPTISKFGDRLLALMHNEFYGIISYNTLKIRTSGKNFNIKEFTDLPISKNLPAYEFAECGYENMYHISGRSLLVQQEFTTWQRYCKVAITFNGGLSYPLIHRLIDMGTSTNRIYLIPIWNGTLNTFYIMWQDLLSGGGAYQRTGIIKSTDGITWSNFYGTWSFNARTAGVQSLATIVTNSGIIDVSGGTLKNAPTGNAAVKSDGTVYFICGTGENTAWQIVESDNSSSWYTMTITISGVSNVLVAPDTGDNNRYEPIVWFDSTAGIYKCLMLVDPNLDGLYRVGLFHQTAINKAGGTITMTFQSYVSTDDTKKHWHLIAPADYEFANAAYVKGTIVDGSDGHPWYYKIK